MSYHRRVKSDIGSHDDQIDLNSVGGVNQVFIHRVEGCSIAKCQVTLPRGKMVSITADFDRETRHLYAALTRKHIM